MEVQDIFEDLVDPDPAGDQDPYADCVRKLDHYFRSEEHIPNATCSGSWGRLRVNRLIGMLCVSLDRQGIVTLVILSMTTYEIS